MRVQAILVMALAVLTLPGCGADAPETPVPSPAATATPAASPTATPATTGTPWAGLPAGPFQLNTGVEMTITIPAPGWTWVPQAEGIIKGEEVANLPEAAIHLWGNEPGTEFYVPADPCRVTSTRPGTPATTVKDLADALAAQADRAASEVVDVTIGGHAGKWVTVRVPEDAVFAACETGQFVSYGTGQELANRWAQGPGQIEEFWLVDVSGSLVVLNPMYRPDTSSALVEEMRSIVESTKFETP